MAKIEVDTVIADYEGESNEGWSWHLEHIYPVSVELVQLHGPAGGNAVFSIEGDERYLRRILIEQYNVDEEDIAELYGI